jgi:hypothetical protein
MKVFLSGAVMGFISPSFSDGGRTAGNLPRDAAVRVQLPRHGALGDFVLEHFQAAADRDRELAGALERSRLPGQFGELRFEPPARRLEGVGRNFSGRFSL